MIVLNIYLFVAAFFSAQEMVRYGSASIPWISPLPITLLILGCVLACSLFIPQCKDNKCPRITAFCLWFFIVTIGTNVNWLVLMHNDSETSPSAWLCNQKVGLGEIGQDAIDDCKADHVKELLVPAFVFLAADLWISWEVFAWMRDANKPDATPAMGNE